jgi:hypothetical protein
MLSATALLWIRIGVGLLPVLIAAQIVHPWHTRRMAQALILAMLAAVELALLPLALGGGMSDATKSLSAISVFVPLACLMLGAGSIVRYLQGRWQARASARWPTVAGTIRESRLAVEFDDTGDEIYRPNVRFIYRVGGREFEGSTVKWGPPATYAWRSRAAAAIAAYPAGKAVTVHYDPAKPELAVLEPLNREGMTMPLAFAAVCGGVGLVAFKVLIGAA